MPTIFQNTKSNNLLRQSGKVIAGSALLMGDALASMYTGKSSLNNTNMAFRKGNARVKTQRKRKSAGATAQSVKTLMYKTIDNHHCTLQDSTYTVATTHNSIYTANLTATIVQGNSNTTRIGDKIRLEHVEMSFCLTTPSTSGAYTYRILVFYSGDEFNPTGFGAGFGLTGIFLPNTGQNFTAGACVNPKAISLLSDKQIDINSTITGVSDLRTLHYSVSLKRDFLYRASGSVYGKINNLYCVVIGFVAGGIPATTATGTILMNSDIVFKPL